MFSNNGCMSIRVENIWYDLLCIKGSRSVKSLCCRLRDFFFGLVQAALGWQPIPGSTFWGGRCLATVRRLQRMLRQHNCEIVHIAESQPCPRFMGFSTQTSVLARKIEIR